MRPERTPSLITTDGHIVRLGRFWKTCEIGRQNLGDFRKARDRHRANNMRAPTTAPITAPNTPAHACLSATLLVAAMLAWPSLAAAGNGSGAAFLEKLSLNSVPARVVIVCHGFGCAYRDQLVLTPARLSYLRGLLGAVRSAKEERKALARAVAWFDREGGRAAGTVGRIARAGADTKSGPSQMDCIDLTANITELLIALDENKLLKYHRVGEPVSRGIILDGKHPHTTPVIVEIASGTQWSVDSWTKAYGRSPDIMTIGEWKSRS
jgi:hypothetical protein